MEDFPIVRNTRYEIETPHGFVDFDGIGKITIPQTIVKITLKSDIWIRVSYSHVFVVDMYEIQASELQIGDYLQTVDGFEEISDICFDGEEVVYDLLEIHNSDHTYYANGIVNHNCKFLGSQDTLIDSDILEQMMPAEPVDLKYGSLMCIYEKPIAGEFYVLGVDPATGVGADYSVIQVLRIIDGESIEQVATYRYNKISLTNFTEVVISVSDYYNNAKMIVENNLGGESVCEAIWYTYENENLVHFENDKLGIRATTKTKFAAVMNMKRYIENGWVTLRDKDTIDELSRYIEVKKGQFSAGGSKQHDDLVAGLYWALYFVLSDEYTDEFGEEDDGKPKKINDKYRLDRDGEYDDREEDDNDTPTQFFFSD